MYRNKETFEVSEFKESYNTSIREFQEKLAQFIEKDLRLKNWTIENKEKLNTADFLDIRIVEKVPEEEYSTTQFGDNAEKIKEKFVKGMYKGALDIAFRNQPLSPDDGNKNPLESEVGVGIERLIRRFGELKEDTEIMSISEISEAKEIVKGAVEGNEEWKARVEPRFEADIFQPDFMFRRYRFTVKRPTATVTVAPEKFAETFKESEKNRGYITTNASGDVVAAANPNTALDWKKARIYFKENTKRVEFTQHRAQLWILINGSNEDTMCFRIDPSMVGKLITNRITEERLAGGVDNYSNPALASINPVGIRQGDKLELSLPHREDLGREVLKARIKKAGTDTWQDWWELDLIGNKPAKYDSNKPLNLVGLLGGVSVSELTGVRNEERGILVKELKISDYATGDNNNIVIEDIIPEEESSSGEEGTEDSGKKIKYVILATGGQSNMVGYDESVIRDEDYPVDNKLLQMGIYGSDKNKIIPLGPHAHGYQDMRPYSNPNNTTPNLGTKGIHYPLAKSLLEYVSEGSDTDTEEYRVIVVNGAFGSTYFGNNAPTALESDGLLPVSRKAGAMWSVNSAYYLSIKNRIEHLLKLYPEAQLLGMIWCQGEHGNNANIPGLTAMVDDWNNYYNSKPEENRYYIGKEPNLSFFFFEGPKGFKKDQAYRTYLDTVRDTMSNKLVYVDIDDNTDTNAVNGTRKTTSNVDAHFGNDSYKNVIAPAVMEAIKHNALPE